MNKRICKECSRIAKKITKGLKCHKEIHLRSPQTKKEASLSVGEPLETRSSAGADNHTEICLPDADNQSGDTIPKGEEEK